MKCCITKAESGMMGVREEQMCWTGVTSGNKPHFYLLLLLLDPVHLSSSPSVSLPKINLYWPNVLIPITWLSSHVCHCNLLGFVLSFHVVCSPEQFTDSFIVCWFMDRWGPLLVSCDLFISSHWGRLPKYSAQKHITTGLRPVWC